MRDEMDARFWVEHGSEFTKAVTELFKQAKVAWARLYEIQYDEPWRREPQNHAAGKAKVASCHGA